MADSTPLQQWRQAGRWPECLDRIWGQLEQRLGKSHGTREMITLVRTGSVSGWERLIAAVEEALRIGATDAAAVLHIMRMPDPEERRRYAIALAEEFAQFERPLPDMDEYDLLLARHPMKSQTEAWNTPACGSTAKRSGCRSLAANFLPLAEQAVKENHSHIRYLEALLAMESEERDRHAIANRIRDAQLPRMKTLEEFDFEQAPKVPAARIRELAEGGYIDRSEPVVLIGECGTGKSHLATGLCLAACRQKRRVRFTTAAALVNELVEAKQNNQVRRLMSRWQRYELIAVDEVGYVPLADIGAEFLFQVISERAERAAIDRDDEPAILGMDDRVSESAIVQGAAGPDHGPGAHHRNRHGIVSLPAHGGKAEENLSRGLGAVPFRRDETSRARTNQNPSKNEHQKRGPRQTSAPPVGRRRAADLNMRQNISYRVGQIRVSKWATPEYRTHELRWPLDSNLATVFTTLYGAHIEATDDWVPFERYVFPNMPYTRGFESRAEKEYTCRGPAFLIRAYAKALRTKGETLRVIRLNIGGKGKGRPKVLHFGTSYVVAEDFAADRVSTQLDSPKKRCSMKRKSIISAHALHWPSRRQEAVGCDAGARYLGLQRLGASTRRSPSTCLQ